MELKELLTQIDSLKAEIDNFRPLKPELEQRITQKFRLDWNYHSNAIEGNSLTLGETRTLILDDLTPGGKPRRDATDILGHDAVLKSLPDFIKQKHRLNETAIRRFHEILLHEPYEKEAVTSDGRVVRVTVRLGEYKQEPNRVRTPTGEIHDYARPEDVPAEMQRLLEWHHEREEKRDLHPLEHASLFHHRFVAIHPFDDGNGRMGRILMNLILMQHGFPPVIVKVTDRNPYVAALAKADAGENKDIVEFMARNLVDSERLYLRGARGEPIADADDVDKAVSLLKRELQSAPPPKELTLKVQKEHFEERFFPLLARLDAKLSQFNELFSSATCNLAYKVRMGGTGNIVDQNWRGDFSGIRDTLSRQNLAGHLVTYINLNFTWDSFLRDGPNDFTIGFWMEFFYDQRKFRIVSNNVQLVRQLVYQEWLKEDEILDLVNNSVRTVFEYVEMNLSKNRPK